MLLLRGLPGRWAGVAVSCCVLAGCASNAPTPRGEVKGAPTHAAEMAQSDANRMATLAMQENLDGLLRLADKLYRRNPAEWRKGGAPSAEAAVSRIFDEKHRWRFASLGHRRDLEAMRIALHPEFRGDRVQALIVGLASMVQSALGDREVFYMLDDLEPQHIYNAARNVEIAAWKLATARDPSVMCSSTPGRLGSTESTSVSRPGTIETTALEM